MALRLSIDKLQLSCSQLLHSSIRLKRASGLGIFGRDVNRFNVKTSKIFTKMMQRKFGLQYQYDPEGHFLGEDFTLRLEAKKLLQGKKNPQRAHIHSQVIFTQLTNMISTDSLKVELPESLTITKVKMESDFSRLNIYWLGTGSDEDEPMQSRLDALAFDLRHELQQLGVIGNIPPIKFICDLSQAKLTEINRLLSRADFGEEFDPKTTLQGMLSDAVLQKRPVIPSSPEGSHNKAIEKIANDSKEKKADIFGLDRTRLYNKVLQRKQKNSEEVEEHQQMSEEITSPVVDFQKRLKEYRRFGEVQKKEKRKKVSGRFDDDSESIGNL